MPLSQFLSLNPAMRASAPDAQPSAQTCDGVAAMDEASLPLAKEVEAPDPLPCLTGAPGAALASALGDPRGIDSQLEAEVALEDHPDDLPQDAFWRVETAENYAMIVDAADYFGALRQAMLDAEHSILLIGWDFDARIRLARDETPPEDQGPERLGDFILWLAKRRPNLQIRLLRWATGALASMFRGSTLWTVLRWKAHPQITLRLDSKHPFAGSHHQKIVAIDDRMAFCGGIDTTVNRWDTREHRDGDPRRVGPGGKVHAPWHDVSCAFDGAAALAIGDLARQRWKVATGEVLPRCPPLPALWPLGLPTDLHDVWLGIARSLPKYADDGPVQEVEAAALALIRAARRYIYCENQYFASRRIAQAIAERLVEPDGPEVVVVCPASAEGWLEPLAMNTARARLTGALERVDPGRRLRLYHPVTTGGADIYVHAKVMVVDDAYLRVGSSNFNNRSMRLDSECDAVLLGPVSGLPRGGSPATPERPRLPEGRDVGEAPSPSRDAAHAAMQAAALGSVEASTPEAEGWSPRRDAEHEGEHGTEHEAAGQASAWAAFSEAVAELRNGLLAEHLGVTSAQVAEALGRNGSLIATIEALNGGPGCRRLLDYERPVLTGIEEWLADNEILDPDGPDEMFELANRRGLFRGWRQVVRRRLHLRRARRRKSRALVGGEAANSDAVPRRRWRRRSKP